MSIPAFLRRRRALRWLAPVGALGAAGLAAGGVLTAHVNSDSLRPTTATALIAQLRSAQDIGFSGTMLAQLAPGLPDLPAVASDSASRSALTSGSHSMRFWYGGPDRQRVALLAATSETDVFHLGRDVWQWNSDSRVATHSRLPAAASAPAASAPAAAAVPVPATLASLSPQQLAGQALAALTPSTLVSVTTGVDVADRPAYELVLTPRDHTTRVASVHIEVDGEHGIALGAQVFARGHAEAVIDVSFTSITFKTPASDYFEFSPPPDATVRDSTAGDPGATVTSGSGWTTIAEYRTEPAATSYAVASLGPSLRAVSGRWGTGRLLDSPLVCVLLMPDGRVYAGTVDPAALYAAAAAHR
ncbi:MAG: LolA family protein [Jatrophihabitantaceae bacterium]